MISLSIAPVAASDNAVSIVTYGPERGGTFAKRSPSPSDIVGCARIASRQVCQHRRLHDGHDFASLGTDHRKAQDAVVTRPDKDLHEAQCLAGRRRPSYAAHRQPGDPHRHTSLLCFAFAQSDVSERRLGKHAVRNQPPARAAVRAGQIVPDDPKVVD